MATIKERKLELERAMMDYIRSYRNSTYLPALQELTAECEEAGHVNAETKTRPDESQFFICDNCGKQIELK